MEKLPRLLPQKICLLCEGCCRFHSADSSWRPRITPDEVKACYRRDPKVAQELVSVKSVGGDGYITTKNVNGEIQCYFLNARNNDCCIYGMHPFECQLYPFLLTRREGKCVMLSIHLSCPYVADYRQDVVFEEYLRKLREYFQYTDVKGFIRKYPLLAGNYCAYRNEIEEIFSIE